MLRKWIVMFLIALLIFSNFSIVSTTAAVESTDTLYLIGGDQTRTLSSENGTTATADILPQSNEKMQYVVEGVNGEYKGSGNAEVNLYLNGLAPGIGIDARISYDYDGDGNWDRIEVTPLNPVMATNGEVAPDSYEHFPRVLEKESGQDHASFSNGKIMFEAWVRFGSADAELKVNAPSEASHIVLPYNLILSDDGGSGPGDDEDPGTGDEDVPTPLPSEHYEDWELHWSDEFDGTGDNLNANGVDLNKWDFQTGTGSQYGLDGWGNNEQQYYQEDNARVEDGKLVIEANKEEVNGKPYTSARLFTKPTFQKKYGKFEARMKLPEGDGFWPAFWMMPQEDVYGTWASSGEIDIMEAKGRFPHESSGAIHYGGVSPNNSFSGGAQEFEDGDSITNFHVYSVEWEPGEIRWYVDGKLFHTENNWTSVGANQPAKYAFPAPFDQEFYMILNLAVGGNFDGGRTPDDSELPAQMEVDYVRVYELTGRDYKEPVETALEKEDLPENAKDPIDGNLIWDPDYSEGFTEISTDSETLDTEYWNFVHVNTFGGNGSIATDTLDGDSFAKIDITQAGNATHAVQLIQNMTLGTARHYKVSFDAKAAATRNINVKASGGASRGWASYSSNESFALTDEVQSYDFTFQMGAETDPLARLEFNLGTTTGPVWIGNVKVEEIQVENNDPYNENAAKEPLGDGNHIYNGTFDLGDMDRMTYWNFDASDGTATASVNPEERRLNVAITDGGSNIDDVTLTQKGINLLQNNDYKVTFDASADQARDIEVELLSKDGSTVYGQETLSLTTANSEHSFTFTMNDSTDVEGQFVVQLGGNNANVTIDNVKVIRTTNNIDFDGIDVFPLDNGDFSDGQTFWETYVHNDGAAASFSFANEEAKATVTGVGGQPWGIQLFQSGMEFTKGIEYVLSFDAKSTQNRTIGAILENATYTRYIDQTVELTNQMQNYSFDVKMPATDTADLKFLLGSIDGSASLGQHDVVIDNVVLEVKDAPINRPPSLKADVTNTKLGQAMEITFKDDADWRDHVTAVKLDGQALAAEDYTLEAGKLILSADLFSEATAYEVVVESDGYASSAVTQNVDANDGNLIRNGDFANNTQNWETWSGEGGAAAFAVTNGIAELNVTALGSYDYANQFFQGPINLEVGKTYELSFKASSTIERPIQAELFGEGSARVPFNFTTAMETYSHEFTATEAVMTLNFMLGDVVNGGETTPTEAHTVSFDDFVLKEKVEEPQEPEKDWVEIGENLVIDGGFDTTTTFGTAPDNLVDGWNIFNQGDHEPWAGKAAFNVENGELKVNVQQVGWAWWQIQLLQNLDVPAGMYKVSFDAKSDEERPMSVELAGSEIQTFTVGNNMQTYEAVIEVGADGVKQLLIGLGRGENDPELTAPYNMVIDNVRLIEVEEDPGTEDPGTEDPGTEDPGTEDPGTEDKNVTLDDKVVNELADDGTIEVNLDASQETLKLTAAQVAKLKQKNAIIHVNKDGIDMMIPASNLSGDGDVVIKMERFQDNPDALSPVYDFSIKQGDTIIDSFENPITLKFKVDESKVDNPDDVKLYYYDENNGEWVLIGGTYADGYVIAETSHFSTFTVFEIAEKELPVTEEPEPVVDTPDDDKDEELPDTASNMFNFLLIGGVLLLLGMLVLFRKRIFIRG
ncbi:carbohydrate binding domain-containing protein [Gracilibacillus kekensis]|uniref:LPXTG-motif cell wall anchor domain-containing protein n=1 Tax=Gracilibacillus kekensis TaxID=1027249 RepID=A0A1M7Q1M6_9BACI|nr:carbohydrate binding domain-containing protein [Gracilibacillus kekensis]SHN24063.1 LPXTG-motif cell wall anchor domain-containing protein [Gracilibacillus kekensis]